MTTDFTELAKNPTRYGTNSQGVFTNQTDGAYVSYLDFVALVEALEKAQTINAAAEKLVRCKGRYHSEQNYRALAALFGVTTPDLPPLDGESRTVKLPDNTPLADAPEQIWLQTDGVWPADGEFSELTWCTDRQHDDDTLYVRADLAAGIKWEAE